MTIILAIIVISILIFVHELGHFLVAKWAGIKVYEFALGMGPAIFSKKGKETKYSLRAFPVGGFNKMAGLEPGDEDNPRGFNKKSVSKRIAVISAGSLMNFLLAIVLFISVFAVIGMPSSTTTVGEVLPGGPAAEAGLNSGDKITAVDGENVETWSELVEIIHDKPGETVDLTVQRTENNFNVTVTPELDKEQGVGLIGIKQSIEKKGLIDSIFLGINNAVNVIVAIIVGIVQMITGKMPAEVAGPVGIVNILGDVAQYGIANILNFTAVLSLNLGLLNLLPIPALDGSRLIFLFVEGIRGKPIAQEKENLVHLIGFALLISLMLFVTYHDIMRIIF